MTFYDNAKLKFPSNGFKATSSSPAINKRSSTPSSAENQAFVSFLPDTAQSDICNSEIIRRYIQSREDQYCDYDRISIFCGTYNVNGQSCNGVSLDDWLAHKTQEAPDIYAIGFQELDLSQQAYIFDTGKEHEWACTVKKSLPSSENFKELKRIRLVGIFLLVYIKKRLFGFVDHNSVECNSVATGLLNMMGNKGAVAVRFKIHDSTLCFIASHLAAGSDELMRRNQDYKEICKLYFQPSMPLSYKSQSLKIEIFDHDLIFWLGDLNYRLYEPGPSTKNFYVGTNLDAKFVKHKCNLFEYDFLLRYDQLSIMRRENLAFHEFREGLITFAPTYKYDPGTDVWDTSEKCRAPAWTDRILWIGDGIEQLHYDSVPSLKLSDHKPVYSLFQAKIRRINDAKYSKIYESALREADRIENEYLPQVKIDKLEFHFKDVKFFEPQSDNCVIKNVGKLPVQYSFVSKSPSTKEYCKSWIMVTPDRFTIKVDEECVLNVTVTVDKMSVRKILTGEDNMQDHLVLHLHGGRHIFLSISANFIPTCFGRSLSELMTYKQTGVEPNVGKLIDLEDEPETTQCKRMSNAALLGIPVQIYRLATQIIQKGSQMPHSFGESNLQSDFLKIRDALDLDSLDSLPGSVDSLTEALLRFLDTLPEPVIPYAFYDKCIRYASAATRDPSRCKEIVNDLPECHKNVFLYIIDLIKELKNQSNHEGYSTLAKVFAPVLLKSILTRKDDTDTAAAFVTTACELVWKPVRGEDGL